MESFIASFEYKNSNYIIKFIEEKKVGFFRIDDLGNLDDRLTEEERKVFNKIYKSLQVNLESSNFYTIKQIGNNNYSIYYDKNTHNYFWVPINKIYNSNDNIKLNFKYNYEPNILYNTYNNKLSSNNNIFNKLVKIGKKYILVFVSATIVLSSLAGCSIKDNQILSSSEVAITSPQESANIIESEPALIIEETPELPQEYNYDDIRNIIISNPYLSIEEKAFINKLQFVFDEYHEYMDLKLIKERLQTLKIEYQEKVEASRYIVDDNKIIIMEATCFKDAEIKIFLHEFLHVLQSGGSRYYTKELSNEFFTKEVLTRLYKEKLLVPESEEGILNIDDVKTLKDVLGEYTFLTGYTYHMPVYYILAEILSREVLCAYQFNPENIEILKDGLKNISGVSSNEEIEMINNLINHIIEFRDIDIESREYIYTYPNEQIYNELDYFYQKAKGKSIKEDFLTSLRMVNNEMFTIFTSNIYYTEYYQDIINKLSLFLEENKGLGHLSAASLIDKTILSDSGENAMIIGFLSSGEDTSIIIDDELQSEYSAYLKNSESLEQSTRK